MSIQLDTHLADYVGYLQGLDIPCSRHHMLLACMPKSGSTWLSAMLAGLPDFHLVSLVNGWDRREQELTEINLLLNHELNYVSQIHLRYSEPTARLIQKFALKPIVLVRNIFDVVPSIRDHVRREGGRGPICHTTDEMRSWPSDKLDDFIVDMGLPWYLSFFLGWQECANKLLVTYEELLEDPHRVLEKICVHYEIGVTTLQINAAVALAMQKFTGLNRAEVGRGETLSAAAKLRILMLASYYEGADFTPIGIPPAALRSQDKSFIMSSRIASDSTSEMAAEFSFL